MNKKTNSNIPLDTSYGPKENNKPGEFPFTNGIYPEMYRQRLWTMRQYSGFSSAKESNQRYQYLLEQGVKGLSVAFDLPTQTGYDSDHSLSAGEEGSFKGNCFASKKSSHTANSFDWICCFFLFHSKK